MGGMAVSEVHGKCCFCVRNGASTSPVCNLCLRNPARYDWEPTESAKIALRLEADLAAAREQVQRVREALELALSIRSTLWASDALGAIRMEHIIAYLESVGATLNGPSEMPTIQEWSHPGIDGNVWVPIHDQFLDWPDRVHDMIAHIANGTGQTQLQVYMAIRAALEVSE